MVPAIFGALLGGASAIFGGLSKRKAARAQAEASRLNAQQIRERADIETTLRGRAGQRESGTIAANAGASGLAGGGSAADILRESTRNRLFDLESIQSQSELEARVREQEARGARSAGNRALIGSGITAAGILLRR